MKLDQLKLNIDEIPFKKSLSFLPLINMLKEERKNSDGLDIQAESILNAIEGRTALFQSDFNIKNVEKYKKEIHVLMSYFFTSEQYKKEIGVAASPFDVYSDENVEIELVEQKNKISAI